MHTLYQHPRCSTCKRALAFVEKEGIPVNIIDITTQAPSPKELKAMLRHQHGELRRLFNTSGQLYRAGDYKNRLPSMSEDEALAILANEGMLVKRPFLLGKDFGLVGFKEDQWRESLC